MSLHLIKLCVGCDSPDDLQAWQTTRPAPLAHVTRMWPRRADEIAGKGSLYWVMKGEIRARQAILDFEERFGDDGIRRCAIIFSRELILTRPTPRRPFQGWRYLQGTDAPADLGPIGETETLPADIEAKLAEFGVG